MTGREIIEAIKAALEADAQVKAWCQDKFSEDLTVTVGWSTDDVPTGDWPYPVCNLALWKVTEGETDKMASLELDIEAQVLPLDTTKDETVLLADDLACMCRDAIARAKIGNDVRAEIVGGMTELHPRGIARGTITINRLRSHRAGLGR